MESTKTVKEKEKKEPMTPKQKTFFILKIIGNVIFYGVIIALFLFSIMNINAGRKHGIPNIFGRGYLVVLTDSMEAEEEKLPEQYKNYSIKQFKSAQAATKTTAAYDGDLLNVKMLNRGDINSLKLGDVITYWDDGIEVSDGSKGAFNTHRITYIHKNESGNVDLIHTIGDRDVALFGLKDFESMSNAEKMAYENESYLDIFGESNFSNIKAIVTSVNYNGAGIVNFIQNNWLFIFVIPICIVLVVEVILVIKNILDLRREKNKAVDLADHEAQMAELQNEKERMRQELLAELRAQGAIQDEPKPTEEPKVEKTPVVAEEAKAEAKEETTTEEVKEDVVESEEKAEEPAEEPVEEKAKETVEETPAEDKNEEVVEETTKEEVNETPASEPEEEVKEEKEEPVVNEEEVEEPNLDIEENEEVEEKPAKKATTKKSTGTKKSSTTKK